MATNTTKLALSKPDGTDLVDVAVLNNNFDKIDTASGAFICTSTTRPPSPWNGQLIFETDTLNVLVYRTSTSSWSLVGGSSVGSNPPAGAGNGNFWWDSDNGKLYIYYNDGNSAQWVSVMPAQTAVDVTENYIINGAFEINQRNFSSSTSQTYGFDRWLFIPSGGTVTHSAQTFTLGSAPVAGYEGTNYARIVTTGQTATNSRASIQQPIENVRTLAGQTITVSFWAKASSGTPNVSVELVQSFGSGGSPSSTVTGSVAANTVKKIGISSSWARYSATLSVPSIAGKTIGTDVNSSSLALVLWVSAGSDSNTRTDSLGIQSNTFDFWGVQVEKGSVATAFRRNANSIQGELAACQRYYYRIVSGSSAYSYFASGVAPSTTAFNWIVQMPVTMRVAPISIDFNGLIANDIPTATSGFTITGLSLDTARSSIQTGVLTGTYGPGGLAQFRNYYIIGNNTTGAFLGFSAEL